MFVNVNKDELKQYHEKRVASSDPCDYVQHISVLNSIICLKIWKHQSWTVVVDCWCTHEVLGSP